MSLIHRTFRHRFKLCTQARPDRRRRPLLLLRPVREAAAVEEGPQAARADGARRRGGAPRPAQEGRRGAGRVRRVRGDLQEQGQDEGARQRRALRGRQVSVRALREAFREHAGGQGRVRVRQSVEFATVNPPLKNFT